jgi:ferredoxin
MEYEIAPDLMEQVNSILRKEIDPIYREVAKKIAPELENSQYMPWLLAHKMSPEGCRVLLALPDPDWVPELGDHGVSDGFIEKLGMDPAFVRQQLEDSYYNGDVYPDPERGPILAPNRGIWTDTQNGRRWRDRNGPAYYLALRMMHETECGLFNEAIMSERIARGIIGAGRIVPRYDSVKDHPDLLPVENYKEILKSRKIISQNDCPCRYRYPELGQDGGVCLSGNKTAEMMIKRDMGTEIPWEDAFEYIQKAGKEIPFCQTAKHCINMEDMGDIFCNCHPLSCSVLRHTFVTGGKYKVWDCFQKSRFRAVIDNEKCINCGLCAKKRCIFNAIKFKYLRSWSKEGYTVDEDQCMGCGCCVETCPTGALSMKLVDPPEVLLGYVLDEDGKPIISEGSYGRIDDIISNPSL